MEAILRTGGSGSSERGHATTGPGPWPHASIDHNNRSWWPTISGEQDTFTLSRSSSWRIWGIGIDTGWGWGLPFSCRLHSSPATPGVRQTLTLEHRPQAGGCQRTLHNDTHRTTPLAPYLLITPKALCNRTYYPAGPGPKPEFQSACPEEGRGGVRAAHGALVEGRIRRQTRPPSTVPGTSPGCLSRPPKCR